MKLIHVVLVLALSLSTSSFASRVKDLATIKGVRSNQMMGYGLVVGLNGTGDTKLEATNKSLAQMFRQMGVDVKDTVSSKNVAAVMITAELPPFARVGGKLDVVVSSVGDASSLQGGTLILTPLKGGDQNIYAVAQGQVVVGGMGSGKSSSKNHPTVGRIPGGGIIEREIRVNFDEMKSLRLTLHSPDFTTAARMVKLINLQLGGKFADARDSRTLDVIVPFHFESRVVDLIALIETIEVTTDAPAKVMINERTGTVVMGESVRIDSCSISHGGLTISIEEEPGSRDVASGGAKKKGEEKGAVVSLPPSAEIKDVVRILNKLGVTPRDLIDILQAMKSAGALHAELVVL